MFHEARIRLTGLYLLIIVLISLFFSIVIYAGVNQELSRIEEIQRIRQERLSHMGVQIIEQESIPEVRRRILLTLGILDAFILVVSGISGYFLAGKTLYPIEEMLNEQKNFVSNASHELRTPLTSLKTEIEVALRDKSMTMQEARKLLNSNLEEVDKMQKLSNYLLNLNKYQEGETDLEMKATNLKDVAENALKTVNSLAKERGIKIQSNLQETEVMGDRDSLIELTTILLDNAIKYSKDNGKVIIKTGDKSLTVQDFGQGIVKEDLSHIFERFYRADESRSKEKTDGYGLGLAIAKNIADAHGAKIKVKSAPGKGATFKVLLSKGV